MKPSIEKLQKFFKLEAEREYDDKAVMGGLGNMLESWVAEARADGLPEGLVEAVSSRLRDYGRLSPNSRKTALKGLWNRIRRELKVEGEEPDSAPTQPPADEKETAPEDAGAGRNARSANSSCRPPDPACE